MALIDDTKDGLFTLPPTLAGRRRKVRNRLITAGAVLVLIAGLVRVLTWPHDSSCAPGIASINGECIGVTAGDFAFNPGDARFSAAEDRIRQLNEHVTASGRPYVTTALLTSLTWTSTSALSRSKIVHQLEGAAVALDRVNNKAVTGNAPLIELLLANEGTDEDHNDAVVRQLTGMTGGDHPLDAVIGMGVSSGATVAGATELSKAGVLMVASNVTGDDLDSARIPGFGRVSTPNRDDVAAIAAYLATRPDLHRTMLVHAVSRTGDNADYYTSSLAADFQNQLGNYATVLSEPFDVTALGNSFNVIATNLCTSHNPPNVVLYAGREPDLPAFIQDLAQRVCNSTPITLVVGTDSCALASDSDDPQQASQVRTEMARGKITVLCPAWVAPQDWAASASATNVPAGFSDFVTEFDSLFAANGNFGTQLDDGYAIMTHDALLTAAKAIRLATQPPVEVPTSAQVLSNQYYMDSANTVPGASGTFTFVEANNGNPAGKPVFVLRLQPSGPPVLLYTYPGR
jgi:hypothetical protein